MIGSAPGPRRRIGAVAIAAASSLALVSCAPTPPPGDQAVAVRVTAAPVETAANADPNIQATILAKARQFVFRVRNENCLAVGTAFAASGEIITNRHVAAGATSLDLATWDGQDFSSDVAGHDDTEDLALLDGVPPEDTYATLALSDPRFDTPVWVAGYPLGNQLTLTSGKILGEVPGTPFGLGAPVLEISDPIQHGNSGSPLLDAAGDVVGVVFAIDTINHDGLAMPVSTLRSLLSTGGSDSSPIPCVDLSQ